MKKIFLVLLSLCVCVAGCKKNSVFLEGEWETYSFEIDGVMQEICISGFLLERSTNGSYNINGNSGVNRFFGSVKVSGSKFMVQDNLASTKMAGEPRAMEFEDNFIDSFAHTDTWEIENIGNTLILTLCNKDSSRKLVFRKRNV